MFLNAASRARGGPILHMPSVGLDYGAVRYVDGPLQLTILSDGRVTQSTVRTRSVELVTTHNTILGSGEDKTAARCNTSIKSDRCD
jgi:hypothetical protein